MGGDQSWSAGEEVALFAAITPRTNGGGMWLLIPSNPIAMQGLRLIGGASEGIKEREGGSGR